MFRPIKNLFLSFLSLLIGMKVTIKSFFSPSITYQYPQEKRPMPKNWRGMVDLEPPACVVCYQCIKICPVAALDLTHKQTVTPDNKKKLDITKFTFNGELCCYCGLCEEICPTDAIFLNKLYEVSASSHDEMNNIDLMDPNKYKHFGYNEPPINYKKEKAPEKPAAPPAPAKAGS
jgi:NADH-quinone oxidoreductase subunit I